MVSEDEACFLPGEIGVVALRGVGEKWSSCSKFHQGALSHSAYGLYCELMKKKKSFSPTSRDFHLTSTLTAGTTPWMS